MSLVSTLGKVAMGVMLAKGVGKMMGGQQASGSGGGLGGLLGSLGGGQNQSSGGGLGDILGQMAGGQQGGGGLGDLLGKVTGSQQGSGSLGGLGDILGSLSKGGSAGGGLGGLAGMLGGAGASSEAGGLGGLLDSLGGTGQSGGLGGLLNNALQGNNVEATPDQEKQAEIMLRAMISAAKADGQIDEGEQKQIADHLDDITPEEVALVQQIMSEPLDLQSLINQIPSGMEQQAYFMSLLAIDLDHQAEAKYLQDLAQGLNLSPQVCNQIHEKLGSPTLYS